MSGTISRSPFLRKRPNHTAPLLGEWTCFKRRGELLVLLGDVVRVEDKGLLKGYYSFPMNAFITLWSQVGYQLSISEEEFIKNNTIAKELMKLVPFNDAAQFIAQYLMKPVQVLLRTFNPVLIDNGNPSTDTITIEPHADDDGSAEPVGDDCKTCEKSPEVNDKSAKLRSLKRGERAVVELLDCAGGSEDSRKKRKASGNPGELLSLKSRGRDSHGKRSGMLVETVMDTDHSGSGSSHLERKWQWTILTFL